MWCDHCGTKLPEDGAFCPACGKAPANNPSADATGFFSAGSLLEEEPAKPMAPEISAPPITRAIPHEGVVFKPITKTGTLMGAGSFMLENSCATEAGRQDTSPCPAASPPAD